MVNTINLTIESQALSELKDKNGNFKYDESSEQFGMTVSVQYEVLKESISKNGQQVPIWIWRDRIVDGRNRVKALSELGIEEVIVKKLPWKCKLEDRMELARNTEYGRRHQTPTQIACDAVKEYDRRKKLGSKEKNLKEIILKETGASSANFSSARWILKNKPLIFKRLFDGEELKLDGDFKKTQSLPAIQSHYKKQEKAMDELKKQLVMEEELAREQIDNVTEEEQEVIIRNGKLKAYRIIDSSIDPLIEALGNSHEITLKDYLSYKWGQISRAEEASSNDK